MCDNQARVGRRRTHMTSGVSRGMLEIGFLSVVRGVAVVAMLAGSAGSVTFMLHASRRQQSRIPMLLFGIWVISPFGAAAVASSVSKRSAVVAQATVYMVIIVLTLSSLAIYGDVALQGEGRFHFPCCATAVVAPNRGSRGDGGLHFQQAVTSPQNRVTVARGLGVPGERLE
jgi:hypothetical protein